MCEGDVFMAMEEYDAAEKSYLTCLQIDPSIRRSKSFKVYFNFLGFFHFFFIELYLGSAFHAVLSSIFLLCFSASAITLSRSCLIFQFLNFTSRPLNSRKQIWFALIGTLLPCDNF